MATNEGAPEGAQQVDLFEQVLHAIEGEETEDRTAYTADGQKPIQVRTFGPDRWIERAEIGRLDAINFLAIILFAVRGTFNLEHERLIVEEWAKIIRAAAMAGEITPRNPVTLLPLQTLPDGWDWLVSLDDADTFVKARGMGWSCTGIVEHLATQSTPPSIALMEQNPQLFTSKNAPAPSPAASSGAPESNEPTAHVSTPARPLPAQRFQEQEILRVISELKYDAKALPKSKQGKKGVKAEVRKIVPLNTPGIFDGAWERLRATGEIQDAT